jgi:hypothetical protein
MSDIKKHDTKQFFAKIGGSLLNKNVVVLNWFSSFDTESNLRNN